MVSAIIPTLKRLDSLQITLKALLSGDLVPDEIFVVSAKTAPIPQEFGEQFPVTIVYDEHPSAAGQRNLGARHAKGDLLVFIDDDVTPEKNCLRLLIESLQKNPDLAGVAGRMMGSSHAIPSSLLQLYYRLQAGYDHLDYGAKVFGPAITTFPRYETASDALIDADWLNGALVVYRKEIFDTHQFPVFEGYAPFEDVYLSISITRTHRLAFHRDAHYRHRGAAGTNHSFRAGRQFITNQRRTAKDVLMVKPTELALKLILHKLFISAHLIRTRPPGWLSHVAGTLFA